MNRNDLAAAYKRKTAGISEKPVYGILNTFNGKQLDKTFDSLSAAQDYMKDRRLSYFFRVIIVGGGG